MTTPIASVVIPAYNEENTIERCLNSLLSQAQPGELEVIVVCNGCSDRTAERARGFVSQGIKVVETPVGSKSNALNLGDEHASHFPRFYVDADIQLSSDAIRKVVDLLRENPEVLLSAPTATVNYSASDPVVRAYYRVWTELPYFKEHMIGSGVYAFSEKGRARFDKFPDLISDDEFARRVVRPEERRTSKNSGFVISAPHTISALMKVNTRVRAGMYELEAKFPDLSQNRGTTPGRTLSTIFKTPKLWKDAPVYLTVMFCAKVLAHKKLSGDQAKTWDRDDTARAAVSKQS